MSFCQLAEHLPPNRHLKLSMSQTKLISSPRHCQQPPSVALSLFWLATSSFITSLKPRTAASSSTPSLSFTPISYLPSKSVLSRPPMSCSPFSRLHSQGCYCPAPGPHRLSPALGNCLLTGLGVTAAPHQNLSAQLSGRSLEDIAQSPSVFCLNLPILIARTTMSKLLVMSRQALPTWFPAVPVSSWDTLHHAS